MGVPPLILQPTPQDQTANQQMQQRQQMQQQQPQAQMPSNTQDLIAGFGRALVPLGMSLIGGDIARNYRNPMAGFAFAQAGDKIADVLQDRWWKREADAFQKSVGEKFKGNLKQLQAQFVQSTTPVQYKPQDPKELDKYKDAPPGAVDPTTGTVTGIPIYGTPPTDKSGKPTGPPQIVGVIPQGSDASIQRLLQAREAFYNGYHQLSMDYMDTAAKYGNNPYISNSAQTLMQNTTQFMNHIAQGPKEQMDLRRSAAAAASSSAQANLMNKQAAAEPSPEEAQKKRSLENLKLQAETGELGARASEERANAAKATGANQVVFQNPTNVGQVITNFQTTDKKWQMQMTSAVNSAKMSGNQGDLTMAFQAGRELLLPAVTSQLHLTPGQADVQMYDDAIGRPYSNVTRILEKVPNVTEEEAKQAIISTNGDLNKAVTYIKNNDVDTKLNDANLQLQHVQSRLEHTKWLASDSNPRYVQASDEEKARMRKWSQQQISEINKLGQPIQDTIEQLKEQKKAKNKTPKQKARDEAAEAQSGGTQAAEDNFRGIFPDQPPQQQPAGGQGILP